MKNRNFVSSFLIVFFYFFNSNLWAEPEIFTNKLGMRFILIPAGSFIMGSPESEEGRQWNETQHKVVISKSFYLGETEVTQGQWEKLVGFNPSSFADLGKNYPVDTVSWNQCIEFIRVLNEWEKTDKYRLPTEAEWEYSARGGLQSATYPWGGPYLRNSKGCFLANFKPLRGNYSEDGGFYPVKVTSYFPNDYGLYCMAGNAAEWTSNAFDESSYDFSHDLNPDYVYEAQDNEANVLKRKVIRGGSWKDVGYYLQTSTRTYEFQDTAKCVSMILFTYAEQMNMELQPR